MNRNMFSGRGSADFTGGFERRVGVFDFGMFAVSIGRKLKKVQTMQ